MTDTALKDRIDQIVEEHRDSIVASLARLLQFDTVSGGATTAEEEKFARETAGALAFLKSEAEALGLDWSQHENTYAYADLAGPEGAGFVGLPIHTDVVPAGDGWTHPPFGGVVADGVIYGRGCQDDKGPAVQVLYAVGLLKKLGLDLKRGARVIVGTVEECGDWSDIALYIERERAPELTIVPDAAFPIINGEKGVLNLKLTADLGGDSSSDVGGCRFVSATAGERANIVPPLAELRFEGTGGAVPEALQKELAKYLERNGTAKAETVSDGDDVVLRFHGRGAHGSTPQEGHNAALDLLRFMMDSGFVTDEQADMAEFLFETGGDLTGARLGIETTHDLLGPTTVNLGVLKWTREQAEVTYNIRPTKGLAVGDAVARAQGVIADFAEETGFEVSAAPAGKALDAIFVDPAKHPEFIGALKEAYTAVTGREATLGGIGGTTYAKKFPNAVCYGPVDPAEEPELAHQTDERVAVEHHLRNVRIYTYALARLCGA